MLSHTRSLEMQCDNVWHLNSRQLWTGTKEKRKKTKKTHFRMLRMHARSIVYSCFGKLCFRECPARRRRSLPNDRVVTALHARAMVFFSALRELLEFFSIYYFIRLLCNRFVFEQKSIVYTTNTGLPGPTGCFYFLLYRAQVC